MQTEKAFVADVRVCTAGRKPSPLNNSIAVESSDFDSNKDGPEDSPDGCEDDISQWTSIGGGVFGASTGI